MKKVEKPWGYEIIYALSDKYCGKILHINAGEKLSLQYHVVKDETIYISNGLMELTVEVDGKLKEIAMEPGDSYHIGPMTRHRYASLKGCDVLEVSTPELDDVVRLEDSYGRIKPDRFAIIMAGGYGTRFWPLSRRKRPKQFLDIFCGVPMIKDTVRRVLRFISPDNCLIIANREHRDEIKEIITELPEENLIFEPVSRNTAACIGLGALIISKRNRDGVMGIFPSDHLISAIDTFENIVNSGFEVASKGDYLITLGMEAEYPETGYGYIKKNEEPLRTIDEIDFYGVEGFEEKPDRKRAEELIHSGDYLVNAGIFIGKADTILNSIEEYLPELHMRLMEISGRMSAHAGIRGGDILDEVTDEIYPEMESISIDYGVMEKADNLLVVPSNFGWSDVGGWAELLNLEDLKDENDIVAWGETVTIDTKKSIIFSPEKLVATIGLENIIIVETKDALMVCTRERAQDIKKIVEKLEESKLKKYL